MWLSAIESDIKTAASLKIKLRTLSEDELLGSLNRASKDAEQAYQAFVQLADVPTVTALQDCIEKSKQVVSKLQLQIRMCSAALPKKEKPMPQEAS